MLYPQAEFSCANLTFSSGGIKNKKVVVGFFKLSNAATQKLIKYEQQSGVGQPNRLLQDVITSWNSTFLMLQRLLQNMILYNWDE